ncbi:uncharacterized protein PHACADRAFT_259289 [Phanerochaete carnosa HHB-10118-sp]|uniref:Uncharacterized protein n=1 Tax=Phanerochaete carnosa (strain HHB-10118-sp) TaxID=650164 RepID=K5UT34_PHACS|nr:uncharacterized protein PHACADRAFT_259289 [Phanerochaete carnosa HHB-10118-sp]EKM53116.1 hypothetical protein PHACADRAFT_259289 [Phanerochaete carnosa HHB-10118-sp]
MYGVHAYLFTLLTIHIVAVMLNALLATLNPRQTMRGMVDRVRMRPISFSDGPEAQPEGVSV